MNDQPLRSDRKVDDVPSRTSAHGGEVEVDVVHLVVPAEGLPWRLVSRNLWFAKMGAGGYSVAWDFLRKDDWSALWSSGEKPFAHVDAFQLAPLVEDLKRWIHSTGGEIPQASRG